MTKIKDKYFQKLHELSSLLRHCKTIIYLAVHKLNKTFNQNTFFC